MNILKNNSFEYSAIIVTFQSEELLYAAITSILSQTILPKEIILVDDCSDFLELGKIRKLIPPSIDFIPLVNIENRGAGFSRNRGVSKSNTEYLVFFDDDDISLSNRVHLHREAFRKGASVSYVSSRKKYPNGYSLDFANCEIEPNFISPFSLADKLIYGRSIPEIAGEVPSATLAMTRTAFKRVVGFDEALRRLEDVDIAIRLSLAGETFAWSSKIAVERTSTSRRDKGGIIETFHEELLIEKYGELLSWWQRVYLTKLVFLRGLYFGGFRGMLSVKTILQLLNPICMIVIATRFGRFLTRITHDRKQVIS